jgi:hypothetical protein
MNSLQIAIQEERTSFRPGEECKGEAKWTLAGNIKSAEVRLFWYTGGKGTSDMQVVDTNKFQTPKENDQRSFSFKLPEAPYSFSGKLISLMWAIELVVEPDSQTQRLQIVLSPTGEEIALADPAIAQSVL